MIRTLRTAVPLLLLLLALAPPLPAAEAPACSMSLEDCIAEKRQLFQKRGVLGLSWSAVVEGEPAPPGSFVVRAAAPGFPAHAAGLQLGDLLLSFQGKPLTGVAREELDRQLEAVQVGEEVFLEISRDGKKRLVVLKPVAPDAQWVETWVGQHVRRDHGEEAFRRYLRDLRPKTP
jgi:predicted metalloprotease with PDZ domain